MTKSYTKKVKLSVHENRTKWAPFWVVLKKFGSGRKAHPSSVTKHRRHWRRTKLKISPRKQSKSLG